MKHTIFAQIPDGGMIRFKFHSNLNIGSAIDAIKQAVTKWGTMYGSGKDVMKEIDSCFNWGDLYLHHEREQLIDQLKAVGILRMKSESIDPITTVDHDEILFIE